VIALVPLRIVLGLIFCTHGYLKLFSSNFGVGKFADYLRKEGLPAPRILAYGIGLLELAMGLLLTLGSFAQVAAGLLAVHVLLALVTVGPRKGFTRLPDGAGYEYELVLFVGLLALVVSGRTPYSMGP
jgi:uncharacterized membrane protein YphA (DoxX/SURF4 family)